MTPDQFKEARHQLGLTRPQLGAIINTSPDTIKKWEMPEGRSNSRDPNPIACRVLEWLLDGLRPPQWPE
jgi:DNA-binding transcriptional regulator YiaG